MYRKMTNSITGEILQIVAGRKFIMCQTESELISICNCSGLILEKTYIANLQNMVLATIEGKISYLYLQGSLDTLKWVFWDKISLKFENKP